METLSVSDIKVGMHLDMRRDISPESGWFYWGTVEEDHIHRLKREIAAGYNLWRKSLIAETHNG
jgi:hypothetical protein